MMWLIKLLLSLWRSLTRGKAATSPTTMAKEAPVAADLTIPYPEEPPDYTKTVNNTDIAAVLNEWLINYHVPPQYWDYWRTKIEIRIDPTIKYPALTYERNGVRYLEAQPAYFNPGVVAHEQAHNSYSLLTGTQKAEFSVLYTPLKTTDPLIVLLYSKNTYGLTSDVEAMAEIYRYIGPEKMPQSLKRFYPKLIGG